MGLREQIKFILFACLGIKVIHCLGDSHVEVFKTFQDDNIWKKTRFRLCVVPGASAMGLVNPNSRTNAIKIFHEYLCSIPKKHTLLFCLGEVDCGFVIWYRAKKYNLSVEAQFEQSLSNYKSFLDDIFQQGYQSIIVQSSPLPTIQDDQDWGEVAMLRAEQLTRKEVEASLKDRTKLTIKYNDSLRTYCDEKGFIFLDLQSDTLDPVSGQIKEEYLNKDHLDHHHDCEMVSRLLIKKLTQLGVV